MSKKKGQRTTSRPQSNVNSQAQFVGQVNLQLQKTAEVIKSLESQVNKKFQEMQAEINKLNYDLGNAYDVIEAMLSVNRLTIPTIEKWERYSGEVECASGADITDVIKFLNKQTDVPPQIFTQYIYQAFDRRHNLVTLTPDKKPSKDDYAFMVWKFEVDGQVLLEERKPSIYRLGSYDLMVDDKIIEMGAGKAQQFDIEFPKDHKTGILRGKRGNLTVQVLSFKRAMMQQKDVQEKLNSMNQEDKKKIWKEQYKAETIE